MHGAKIAKMNDLIKVLDKMPIMEVNILLINLTRDFKRGIYVESKKQELKRNIEGINEYLKKADPFL